MDLLLSLFASRKMTVLHGDCINILCAEIQLLFFVKFLASAISTLYVPVKDKKKR